MRTGCLFSGYGGLSMAVNAYFGATTAWFSEFDTAPSRILAHHWPDTPNHGDITRIDWNSVEPVDILCGGFPCQDVSAAGRQAGLRHGTRTGLFHELIKAVESLRPHYVVLENVTGLLSADGDEWPESVKELDRLARKWRRVERLIESKVAKARRKGRSTSGWELRKGAERVRASRLRKRFVAEFSRERYRLVPRAIATVLRCLAEVGYDAQWTCVQASGVGACHKRERVFIVATPSDAERGGRDGRSCNTIGRPGRRTTPAGSGESGSGGEAVALLPTPRATDGTKGGPNQRGSSGDLMLPSAVHLLPTPQSADGNGGGRLGSDGHAMPLPGAVRQLLPTPRTSDTNGSGAHGDGGLDLRTAAVQWCDYEAAIRRAELACGRPAPAPTEPNRNGNPRLSSAFAEWMMLLPAGHVTGVGLSRNEELKAIGNGVVVQQALAALERLVPIAEQAAS